MASAGPGGFLSQQGAPAERRSPLPWIIAGAVVVVVIVVFFISGRRQHALEVAENASQTPDAYAGQVALDHLQMSEATNFAGGKVTYVDGTLTNKGGKTLTGVTVLVTFKNDEGELPQVVQMPVSLIRTREPYVDIEPVAAEPLAPGQSHDFRLIFDHVTPTWNQQYPAIVPLRTQTR